MPAKTEKQRRFMGAELRRARAGKKTKTGMTEKQLKEFASETHAVRGHRWQILAAAVVLVAGAAFPLVPRTQVKR